MDQAKKYLDLVSGWNDPNPIPEITFCNLRDHDNFVTIVRDDVLGVGSKVRALDYLIKTIPQNEIVFGSCPATGYAQISLPYVASKYGKKVTLFMAKRSMDKLHSFQKKGIELGANYEWVPDGMLAVTQKRARDYADADPTNRYLLPIGLEHDTVIGSFIKVARNTFDMNYPKTVWSVGSSGTLNRSLQYAFPNAEVHVVSVGHKMSEREIGRAIFHRSPYKFDKPVKKEHIPPYPSALEYDAKLWHVMIDYYKETTPKFPIVIWNVA